jgi:hypothetical protein
MKKSIIHTLYTLVLLNTLLWSQAAYPRKYLFLDDRWIKDSYQVNRIVIQPAKHPSNPVLVPDKPWEGNDVYVYGTVLYDQGKFRMWYQIYNSRESADPRFRTAVAYAESRDGLHWEKPSLGFFKYKDEPTNLVLLSHGTSDLCSPAVIKDTLERDPSRRYKMLYWDSMSKEDLEKHGPNLPLGTDVPGWRAIPGEGFFIAYSPDGIRWTNGGPQPVFTCPCDASSLTMGADGTYWAYFKISVAEDRHFRILGASDSRDFENWGDPKVILKPDWRDKHGTEFYGMSVFDYAGNTIGLIWVYYNAPSDKHVDLQLATRDPEGQWQRAGNREVFLPVGKEGEWDAGGIYAASNVLVSPTGHPNEIWLYYGGSSVTHDDSRYREMAIGRATLRLDGFAAMEAKQFKGYFDTKTVVAGGSLLAVNADCAHGWLQVELYDAKTQTLLAKSKPIQGLDATKTFVEWQHEGKVLLKDRQVFIRFRMQKARLFSFWFEE